jgi:hypothetical protein
MLQMTTKEEAESVIALKINISTPPKFPKILDRKAPLNPC